MQSNPHKLTVIDGETLMDKRLPPTKFCVDTLLPQGLCILGGSPKVGKSWLVLDLCVHVAQGTPLWGLDVTRGDVLYLCLEDSERRIQERLNTITDNVPEGMYFAMGCTSIESGVCDWLRDFKRQHPEVSLIAIDTFQLIRTPTPEVSYGAVPHSTKAHQAVRSSGKYIISKAAIVDFLVSDIAFGIVNKSAWHMNTILQFTKK